MNFVDVLTVTLTLFAVIDILGSIPIIIGLRSKMGHIQSEKATLVSGLIMILFLFVGERLLNLIGIDITSFALAAAFVIFLLALEMILNFLSLMREIPQSLLCQLHSHLLQVLGH